MAKSGFSLLMIKMIYVISKNRGKERKKLDFWHTDALNLHALVHIPVKKLIFSLVSSLIFVCPVLNNPIKCIIDKANFYCPYGLRKAALS